MPMLSIFACKSRKSNETSEAREDGHPRTADCDPSCLSVHELHAARTLRSVMYESSSQEASLSFAVLN